MCIILLKLLCCSVLREQWIRGKYERREFVEGVKEPSYLSGTVHD